MATKNKPGNFNCYANAEPDEPMFVLLGRDRHAPTLVWLWAVLRELDGEDPAKLAEARECVLSMAMWAGGKGKKSVGLGQSVLAGVFELMRIANLAVNKESATAETGVEAIRLFLGKTVIEDEAAG
jgi:hypothetical protein